MKTHLLADIQDELIGKIGTKDRDLFEYKLQIDILHASDLKTSSSKFNKRPVIKGKDKES